jgi:chromosome segregation ATPase
MRKELAKRLSTVNANILKLKEDSAQALDGKSAEINRLKSQLDAVRKLNQEVSSKSQQAIAIYKGQYNTAWEQIQNLRKENQTIKEQDENLRKNMESVHVNLINRISILRQRLREANLDDTHY